MAWTSRRRRKRHRARLLAGSGGDRSDSGRNGGRGFKNAPDWEEAPLRHLRLLRQAIRHGWGDCLSARRKRHIVKAISAIMRREDASVRMRLAAARVLIQIGIRY
jgi:hypothetical protein